MTHVAIIGGGMLGGTLLAGLLREGHLPAHLTVSEKNSERADHLRDTYGVRVLPIAAAVREADVVFLVVKPQDMAATLADLAPALPAGAVVVSLAAGITGAFLASHLPAGTGIIRVMPNTPAQVGRGMSAVAPTPSATEQQVVHVEDMLSALGEVVVVPEEQMDAVTAVSGSGPAYMFAIIEAMQEAGEQLGLPADVARELIVQTMLGAAVMVRETGTDPAVLREQVTSPGGTTAAALAVLRERDVHGAFVAALTAARDRSIELASGG